MSLDTILASDEQKEVVVELDSVRRKSILNFNAAGSVDFGNILNQGASDSFTVELQFRHTNVTSSRVFASKRNRASTFTDAGWIIWRWSGSPDNIVIDVGDGTNVVEATANLSAYFDGNLHWLSVVVDRSAQRLYIYADGTLMNSTGADISTVGSLSNSFSLYLGRDGAGTNFFLGDLDDFRFWTTARTQAQIRSTINTVLVGTETGLAIYCPMDESEGDKLFDKTSNNRDGVIASTVTWVDLTKTWYYSSRFRETGSSDTPANTAMQQYVAGVGPLSQGLSEDVLFSGISTNDPGSIVVIQPLPDVDQLSQLHDYTFVGRGCRVTIGLASYTAYTDFVRYRTTTIAVEPEIALVDSGIQATFKLLPVLGRMLEERLIVNHHVGIPVCLRSITASTTRCSRAHNAIYSLLSYTIVARVKISATTALFQTITSKFVAGDGSDINWSIQMHPTGADAGKIRFSAALGGTFTVGIVQTTTSYADGIWHTITVGVSDKSTIYMMIDDEIIGTYSPTASVGTNTGAVNIAYNMIGYIQDVRIYGAYISPDEMRGVANVRAEGDDLHVVAMWRFDDNADAIANDYSANNLDATIGGTISVDYSWENSDLGEPESAGRPYPIMISEVLNAPAQMIRGVVTGIGDRYRFNDGPTNLTSAMALTVRSQGTVLTGGGVNYTAPGVNADSVIVMTTGEAEPITLDHLPNAADNQDTFITATAKDLLTDWTRISASLINTGQITSMQVLCPWACGYFTDNDTNAQSALQEILGGAGLCYYEDEDGDIFPDFLLQPYAYGPYGEPVLDFRGKVGANIYWGDLADISGSFTVAAWFKTNLIDQTNTSFGGTEPNLGTIYLVSKSLPSVNYELYFQSTGTNIGKFCFTTAGTSLYSPARLVEPNTWYFVAGVFDDAGNTQKIYIGKLGDSMREVASGANAGTPSGTGNIPLSIGSNADGTTSAPFASIQHAQVWSAVKSITDLNSLMATPPVGNEANLSFYAPINEGTGSPLDKVSSTSATVASGVQWAPKLVVNLSDTPSVVLREFRHIKPAYDIKVRHSRNRHPMTDADIDLAIVGDDRIALKREWQQVSFNDPSIRSRFKDARQIIINSPITNQESAKHLLRALVNRFGVDNYLGTLEFPPGLNISRQACGLKLMDEIGIAGAFPTQLSTARSFRVVSVAHDPLSLSTVIGFTG